MSIQIANNYADVVLELDPSIPFSAGRARNEGFEKLVNEFSDIEFVQFVDGDCALKKGWLKEARDTLTGSDSIAAVIGHLQEVGNPSGVFGRLFSMEWHSGAGEVSDFGKFGGITMIKRSVLHELGGYNPSVIAGQDSELGVRMKLAGYIVFKIDAPMATHDAGIDTFRQWWKRSVRAGHAIGQRAYLNGNTPLRDCVHERRSTWFWGIGLPIIIALTSFPTNGLSLFALGGYLVLGSRVFVRRVKSGQVVSDAFLYAAFIILSKFANGVGLIRFYINRFRGQYQIISNK